MSRAMVQSGPNDRVRDRLLRAAGERFNRRGYAATTVREIVEAAGVTKPVLYYYFGSKEGLYLALLEEAHRAFLDCIETARSSPGTTRRRILNLAEEIFRLFQMNLEVVKLVLAVSYGPPQGAPPFPFDAFHQTLQDTLERLVQEGIRSGEFRSGKPGPMATALHGALGACMENALMHGEKGWSARRIREVLNVVFEGIADYGTRRGESKA